MLQILPASLDDDSRIQGQRIETCRGKSCMWGDSAQLFDAKTSIYRQKQDLDGRLLR